MKIFIFSTLAILVCFTQINAQSKNEEAEVLKIWNDVWAAYEKGDENKMWAFYADDACEIYPDGSQICGIANIKSGYEQFKEMMDGQPTWKMSTPVINFIEPSVVILSCDITADIKLKGGIQIGGPSKFMAVLHKVKGDWKVVFDSQTPVLPAPPPPGN